jgi:hypothetical protein
MYDAELWECTQKRDGCTGGGYSRIDPYAEVICGERVYIVMCDSCRDSRAMDI